MLSLTPELLERIRRIANASKKRPEQVLAEAVQEYWIRFATRNGLKPEQW